MHLAPLDKQPRLGLGFLGVWAYCISGTDSSLHWVWTGVFSRTELLERMGGEFASNCSVARTVSAVSVMGVSRYVAYMWSLIVFLVRLSPKLVSDSGR